VLVTETTGLWFDRWFAELISATESRLRHQQFSKDVDKTSHPRAKRELQPRLSLPIVRWHGSWG
jgi:hypothetical protein